MPSFATPEPITAVIEPGVGNVRVIASARTDTVVEVRPSNEAEPSDVKAASQTTVEFSGGTLSVKGPKIRPLDFTSKSRSIEVTVELPEGSRLSGGTGVGALYATGRLGACRYKSGTGHLQVESTGEVHLHTATGNVIVDRVDGKTEVTTSSGRVQLGELTGTANVKNSNGTTTIGSVTGAVRIRAANGDVVVEHAEDSVDAKTANGSARVLDAVRGTVILETAMGDIEIGIREGSAAWLDVKTRFGRVLNDMQTATAPGDQTDKVEVRALTAFGDITVHHS
jgi:hypothetical protein